MYLLKIKCGTLWTAYVQLYISLMFLRKTLEIVRINEVLLTMDLLDVFIRILSLSPTQHSRLQCLWNTEWPLSRYTVNKQITVQQMNQLCLEQLISWLTILNNNSNTQNFVILTLKQNKGHNLLCQLFSIIISYSIPSSRPPCVTRDSDCCLRNVSLTFLPVLSFEVSTSSV